MHDAPYTQLSPAQPALAPPAVLESRLLISVVPSRPVCPRPQQPEPPIDPLSWL